MYSIGKTLNQIGLERNYLTFKRLGTENKAKNSIYFYFKNSEKYEENHKSFIFP